MKESETYRRWGNLPLFVSFPRTGATFVNAVMEVYFHRHRAPPQDKGATFLKEKSHDYMWLHVHDHSLDIEIKNDLGAIFLLRDPVDTLYSWASVSSQTKNIRWTLQDAKLHKEEWIVSESKRYRNLCLRWIEKASAIITYEDMVSNPEKSMRIISEFFQIEYDHEKAMNAIETVTKDKLLSINPSSKYHGVALLDKPYAKARVEFRKVWEEKILDIVYTEETESYFKGEAK